MKDPIKILDDIQKEERDNPSNEICPYAHQKFGRLWDCQLEDYCKNKQSFGYNHYYCSRELYRKVEE